jgi:hypothetical protein
MGTSVRDLRVLTRGLVLWGVLLIAGCAVYHEAYVPGPLQPNNCGTPNAFKACRLEANRPGKRVVVVEELQERGYKPVTDTNDAPADQSRLTFEPVLLPTRASH